MPPKLNIIIPWSKNQIVCEHIDINPQSLLNKIKIIRILKMGNDSNIVGVNKSNRFLYSYNLIKPINSMNTISENKTFIAFINVDLY